MKQENKNNRSKPRSKPPQRDQEINFDSWTPKTEIGRKVKSGEITNIDQILGAGKKIFETQIVDALLKTESELLLIGQSKGKFGGGQRRVFRQTQKKTREGNKPKFSTFAVVGDKNGHVGVGYGASNETVPAREKAFSAAKLNMILIRRGTGSWEDQSTEAHSIPFAVEGKEGSYTIKLMPAPKGKGLICDKEIAKILELAGIQNVWSKSFGQTKNKINVIKATMKALRQLSVTNVQDRHIENLAIINGSIGKKTTAPINQKAKDAEEKTEAPILNESKDEVKEKVEKPTKKEVKENE